MSDEYDRLGVEKYYELHARDYRNVHYSEIVTAVRVLMTVFLELHPVNSRLSVLDLACGSGEATLALQQWHSSASRSHADSEPIDLQVDGADPFTGPAFRERTGKIADSFSFEAVAEGCLAEQRREYDLCICSFAMHLLRDKSKLWCTLNALARSCTFLAILSPHKKPDVTATTGWQLEHESVEARVRVRLYRSMVK